MNDIAAELHALTDEARGLRSEVRALAEKDRRRRAQVLILAASVVFDIALSYFLYTANAHTRDLVHKVDRANSAVSAVCEANNEQAAKQHTLWAGLLALPTSTPADPKTIAAFNKLLDDTFQQRKC